MIAFCITFSGVGLIIASSLSFIGKEIASAIRDLAHEVRIHAEVMEEIKHQGIGIDSKEG